MQGSRKQRVSVVTLGVTDLARARDFYARWGWVAHEDSAEVVFFQANGIVIGLYPMHLLAADQGRPGVALETGALTLAQNYPTEAEVDERFRAAVAAGATMLKRPEKTFWGGYGGYIADPDGHVWELAVNPFWALDVNGDVTMPDEPEGA
jgi:catechol 2,3-dioxygenase-like lactoylglutathione lyase family enzyme